jgi:O-antigen/teichoic acid export membrane protein
VSALKERLNSPIVMLVARLGVAALGLVSAPIIAHALGPVGRGQTAATLAALYLVPILLAIGMPLEVRRRVLAAESYAPVRTARRVAIVMVVPAALFALLATSTVLSSLDDQGRLAAFVGITAGPLMVSWMVDTGVLGARRRFAAVALMQITQPVVFVAGIVLLAITGHISVAGVIWSNFAGSAMTFLFGLLLNRVSLRGESEPWRPLIKGSFKVFGAQASDAAYQRLDQVIMLPLLGAHQAGLYSIAVTIGTLPVFVAHAIAAPVFADVSGSVGRAREKVTGEAVRAALAVGLAAAAFLAVVSPWLVPLLFGEEFREALPAVYFAIAGSIFLVVNTSVGEVLSASNRGVRLTIAQGSGLVMCLSLLLIFGPQGGAFAAAIANASGIATALIVMLFALRTPAHHFVPRPSDVGLVFRRLLSRGGHA